MIEKVRGGAVTRRVAVVVATLGLLCGAFVALAPPAAAGGSVVVTVNKVVVGPAPSSGFTVDYACTGGPSGSFFFGPTGTPIPNTNAGHVFGKSSGGTCTFTEFATAGAASVAFSCSTSSVNVSGCSTNSFTWTLNAGTDPVTITVTNTFAVTATPASLGPLSVTSNPATPGSTVTVSGTGCTKALFGSGTGKGGNVVVTIGFAPPIVLNAVAADVTGAWSVQFVVPPDANGPYPVNAVCNDPIPYDPATLTVATVATPRTTG